MSNETKSNIWDDILPEIEKNLGRPAGKSGKKQTAEEFIATTEGKSEQDKSFQMDVVPLIEAPTAESLTDDERKMLEIGRKVLEIAKLFQQP